MSEQSENEVVQSQETDAFLGIRQELEEIRGQLDALREPPHFLGVQPGQSGDQMPEQDGLSYEAKLKQARDTGDMLAALRIKQEAAKTGVVLF